MKKVCSSKTNDYCFFVDVIDDKVVVVSKGAANPFDNIELLSGSIETLARKINRNDIEIYFDLLSCVGDRFNRFGKLCFHHESNSVDIFSFVNIATEAIPDKIKSFLSKFYDKNINTVIKNSVLTQSEICKVKKIAI